MGARGDAKYFVRDFADMKGWLELNYAGERGLTQLPHEIERPCEIKVASLDRRHDERDDWLFLLFNGPSGADESRFWS